jgi:hypothetical protein
VVDALSRKLKITIPLHFISLPFFKTRGLQSRPEDRLCRQNIENKFVVYGMDYNNLEVPELYVQTNLKNIVLFGPPGRKGTQAERLKEKYD